MQIPSDPIDKQRFYQELVRQCLASRQKRYEFYKQLRNYYLFGSSDATGVPYNKISSTVETLCSFIYAPDAAKFSIHLGTTAPAGEIKKVPKMVKEVNDAWRSSRTHLTFDMGLAWSFVFGDMLFKTMWVKGMPRNYLVEPHQFGVLREDVVDLDDQEAFVHCYTSTRTALESQLEGNPRKNEILAGIGKPAAGGDTAAPYGEGVTRLALSAGISLTAGSSRGGGTVEGGLGGGEHVHYDYSPQIEADLVDMFELYVWNDAISDYQMVTIANPSVVVYDRKQTGVSGVPCFTKLSPLLNLYDYFWAESFVARLAHLQDWRTERVYEIRAILARQADPPVSLSGYAGIAEEKMAAFRKAGGLISSSMPGAKAEIHAPAMPPDSFRELAAIDSMFDDQAGIGHILQGKGEPGVRSRGQADLMARLGSARPKKKAIVVEESAEDVATLMLRCIQENSRQRFDVDGEKNPDGTPLTFIPAQFTNDYEVRVDAHSSSPIFVEDRKNDAITLMENHAIDRDTLLDIFDPPGVQLLKANLKDKIEPAERAAAAAQVQQEAQGGKK